MELLDSSVAMSEELADAVQLSIHDTSRTLINPYSDKDVIPIVMINFASLPVDDLVEMYDVLQSIFCGPFGYIEKGKSIIDSSSADDNTYFIRLRKWLLKHTHDNLDFDSIDVKLDIGKLHRVLQRWTKWATFAMKKQQKECSNDILQSNVSVLKVTEGVIPTFDTRALIMMSIDYNLKKVGDSKLTEGINEKIEKNDEILVVDKKKKKRKKLETEELPTNANFDGTTILKPLLIFDLNKVLVWRRKKSNFFVIRPYAFEVTKKKNNSIFFCILHHKYNHHFNAFQENNS